MPRSSDGNDKDDMKRKRKYFTQLQHLALIDSKLVIPCGKVPYEG